MGFLPRVFCTSQTSLSISKVLKTKFCSFICTSITSVHEWSFTRFELATSLWLKQEDKEVSSH